MPKITFKTLKNDKFQLEFEDATTIGQVKDKVAEERDMLREKMKLILSGKILKDTQTVAECAIKETDFLVIMGKQKPAAAAAPAAAPAAAAPAAAETPAPAPAAAAPAPAAAAAPADAGAPSMGTPEQIAELESMGFARADAEAALRAAFGNQQRATEYLLSPESMPSASAPPAAAGDGDASMDSTADSPAAPAAAASGDHPTLPRSSPLYQYLQSPQFTQLRLTLQQRPELLPSILQQIAQNNPEMAQLFNANREDFYILLNSPVEPPGAGGAGGMGGGPPRGMQIQVTPEENEAIERLCQLGFDRNEVIQAYIACDKNEELAANFLFMDRN